VLSIETRSCSSTTFDNDKAIVASVNHGLTARNALMPSWIVWTRVSPVRLAGAA
jgi:hypothetical protein